jgi:hypothetical protein
MQAVRKYIFGYGSRVKGADRAVRKKRLDRKSMVRSV